jgi:hypothetical protein
MFMSLGGSSSSPIDEATRILAEAESRSVVLRLLGGVAVHMRCPSATHRKLARDYVDIDFMGYSKQSREIRRLFESLGYAPRDRFNAMQGDERLIFNDLKLQRRVDIFLDVFNMCHKFNLKDRLELDRQTIPLPDLLATKLQIVEINPKDIRDIVALLVDHDVGPSAAKEEQRLDGQHLAKLCSDDWGVYKTFTMNLDKMLSHLDSFGLEDSQNKLVTARALSLKTLIEDAPKSLKWKMRQKVGERKQWYELPEADRPVVDSSLTRASPLIRGQGAG